MFGSNRSVGASTADFGIFTGLLAMIFVNWKAFDGNPQLEQTRCCLIFIVVLMIFLNFSITISQKGTVDSYGHLGGALTGLIWGLAMLPRQRTASGTKLRTIGMAMTALYFTLCIVLFYVTVENVPVFPY